MSIAVRSFAKINLGLKIGPARADGFHELQTIYQTLALHDVVRVEVQPGSGIEIRCNDPRVPLDESNTCYQAADRVLRAAKAGSHFINGQTKSPQGLKPTPEGVLGGTAEAVPFQNQNHGLARVGKVVVEIDKRLPVQGGLGAGSSNAVATMLGLERALEAELAAEDKMRIAAEIGSDVPLFLIGGTVLGIGHGEEVYPLPDLPRMHLVVVTPPIAVSTPKAFAQWDNLVAGGAALTGAGAAGTIDKFGQAVDAWLRESVFSQAVSASEPASGVPAMGGDRAETPLLDLVRAGIENDFERVVFPEYPDLREVKRVLEREDARYASLSGSGSALYGLFGSGEEAQAAAVRLRALGHAAVATTTLPREEYWNAAAWG
jgi:4-diphosphocytidyl-2-C-methyl-D-erythritol kinase